MNSFFEKLNLLKSKTLLSEEKKQAIRSRLLQAMEEGEVRVPAEFRQPIQTQRSGQIFNFIQTKTMPVLITLVIVALVGGGVSATAENALPGDTLFPVKVLVNERLVASFALTPEAKMSVEARLAERRLEEAEKLASEGRLSADVRAQIEANFQAHADRVEARIEDLKARGNAQVAADVTSNFEASLKAHEQILARLEADERSEVKAEVSPIRGTVTVLLGVMARERENAEAKVQAGTSVEVQAAAEGRLTAAENKIAEARNFIARAKASLGAEATAKAEARLADAEGKIAEGKAELSAGAFGEAFADFQEASRIAQEAKLLVQARQELKVNVDLEASPEVEVRIDGRSNSEGGLRIDILQPIPTPTP